MTATTADRNRELTLIHIAKAQLQMADDAYRSMLWTVGRVHSAKDLDFTGRKKVLEHMKRCGFKPKAKPGSSSRNKHVAERPNNYGSDVRGNQIKKVEALLADAGRPWSYAEALAKTMFRVDKFEFCNPDQLQRMIAALVYDQKRRAAAAYKAKEVK